MDHVVQYKFFVFQPFRCYDKASCARVKLSLAASFLFTKFQFEQIIWKISQLIRQRNRLRFPGSVLTLCFRCDEWPADAFPFHPHIVKELLKLTHPHGNRYSVPDFLIHFFRAACFHRTCLVQLVKSDSIKPCQIQRIINAWKFRMCFALPTAYRLLCRKSNRVSHLF